MDIEIIEVDVADVKIGDYVAVFGRILPCGKITALTDDMIFTRFAVLDRSPGMITIGRSCE